MGASFFHESPAAREVFHIIDTSLRFPLSKLMFEGDMAELTRTQNAQPALMAVSLAALRAIDSYLEDSLVSKAFCVAGHSLGEYSALTAAGSLSISQAAILLRLRGEAMEKAVPEKQGTMAVLLGTDMDTAENICQQAQDETNTLVVVANDNGGGQFAIAGHTQGVEHAVTIAKGVKSVKRALLLNVSGPFHCSLMEPAALTLEQHFLGLSFLAPCVPIISNVTAQPTQDPVLIPKLLVDQTVSIVRWRESILYMAQSGVTHFIELGSGKVLSGLVKRIYPDAVTCSVETISDIEPVLSQLF